MADGSEPAIFMFGPPDGQGQEAYRLIDPAAEEIFGKYGVPTHVDQLRSDDSSLSVPAFGVLALIVVFAFATTVLALKRRRTHSA